MRNHQVTARSLFMVELLRATPRPVVATKTCLRANRFRPLSFAKVSAHTRKISQYGKSQAMLSKVHRTPMPISFSTSKKMVKVTYKFGGNSSGYAASSVSA